MGAPLVQPTTAPVEHVTILASDEIEKPDLDTRAYRVIRLPNQLEAMLISDPETDKSSAALDVNVGYYNDPPDIPGLAHTLEHLLFMGTEKYPNEADYLEYLSSHSATRNGSTSGTSTVYYFEIPTSRNRDSPSPQLQMQEAVSQILEPSSGEGHTGIQSDAKNADLLSPFYGALDRFAQFFIAPLFLKDSLDREINAVDSEFKRNFQNDDRRLYHLNKSLFNSKHPIRQFSTGNRRSLVEELPDGIDLHAKMKELYATQYSANRMKLVVLSSDSIEELQMRVVQLFSAVKNFDLPRNVWELPVYTEAECATQLFIKPISDRRVLEVQFPYPEDEGMLLAKPWDHLSYVLNQEGCGSLFKHLKTRGWINTLNADTAFPTAPYFFVQASLTKEGLQNYEQVCIDIFHFISLMKELLPNERIFLETQRLAELRFRYREKWSASTTARTYARLMQKPYPRNLILSGQVLTKSYEPEAISSGLSNLSPDKCRIVVVSRDFPGHWNQQEKWYGTEYRYDKISEDFLHRLCNLNVEQRPSAYRLPSENEFIPSDLSVNRPCEPPLPRTWPELIRNDDIIRLWFKKDDQFWVPKANVFMLIRFPGVNITPRVVALSELYCALVRDSLTDYAREAQVAGLGYSLGIHDKGLEICVNGYNDKLDVLLDKVLDALFHVDIREDRFTVIKDRQRINREKRELQAPARQMNAYLWWLVKEKTWNNAQILEELIDVGFSEVCRFKLTFLQNLHAEMIIHGNVNKQKARMIADSTRLAIVAAPSKPFPQSQWLIHRSLMAPPGSRFLYIGEVENPKELNNCVDLIYHVGSNESLRSRALVRLFAQLIHEPAFTRLRTQLQLGYTVQRGLKMSSTYLGFHILVQSEKNPQYVDACIEKFLSLFGEELKGLNQQKLDIQKAGVVLKLLQKPNRLVEETSPYWNQIMGERYDFERDSKDAEEIKKLSKQDILEFFERYISPFSPRRAKLAIHLVSQVAKPNDKETGERDMDVEHFKEPNEVSLEKVQSAKAVELNIIKDLRAFKSGLKASRGPQPERPLSDFSLEA